MKNLCKIIFLCLLLTFNAEAQPIIWQKWYDYNNFDNDGNDVLNTYDGGYIILGNNYVTFNNSTILIKLDSLGEIQWKKIIDRKIVGGNYGIKCFSISQTLDSGFIVSGYTGDSAVLFKTYSNGSLKWLKKYSKPNYEMRFFSHSSTLDGGIIACGDLFPPFLQGIIVKTDSLGNIQWDYIGELYLNVIQARDSSFYFGTYDGILKTNFRGRKIWSLNLTLVGPVIVESPDGYIYSGGYPGIDTMILHKVDSSGSLIWKKKYYPNARCQCICLSNNSKSILLSGYIDTLIQGNIAVTNVDLDGNLIYNRQIYSSFGNNLSFLPYAVKSAPDNGYIMTGFTNYPQHTLFHDNILAVKTDSSCNAPKIVVINEGSSYIPSHFVLHQNYPNPFNPNTLINYELSKTSHVVLRIYDNLGKDIITLVNSWEYLGNHSVEFSGKDLPSGIYYYRLMSDDYVETKRMILLK